MNAAPDLLWDEFESERGFRCRVENKGDFDVAQCLMPLPVASDSYLKGEYRWNPSDRKRISQYGYIADGSSDNLF